MDQLFNRLNKKVYICSRVPCDNLNPETMYTLKNIGLIECGGKGKKFELDSTSSGNGFHLKKVLIRNKSADSARSRYPMAEIVDHEHSIIHDNAIDLVIVSAPENSDLGLVAEALGAGKQVRVV